MCFEKYKVCSLISGGKDSIYATYLTKEQGHNICVFANLYPHSDQVDELDSFCFQTVGQKLVPLISKSTGIPLISLKTKGKSFCSSLSYNQIDKNDEVEDLFRLLQLVLDSPEGKQVNAICCGAIASKYQYNRIQNVADRLNLKILTPLWNKEQSDILYEMLHLGMEIILIKISSVGLKSDLLGKQISKETLEYFKKLEIKFGMNICGEGGEYETFVTFCPNLYHEEIKNFLQTPVFTQQDDMMDVGYLQLSIS